VARDERTEGRNATTEELERSLAGASAEFLAGALENPRFRASFFVLLLRNRRTPESCLRDLAKRREWTRRYETKRLLAMHGNTPPVVARTFLPHLFWRDLAAVADDLRIHPTVRRHGEALLRVRVAEMSLGERISLARQATRGLISALTHSAESAVVEALLGNPRWVEGDAVRLARSEGTPPPALERLARHPTWSRRQAVRLALCRNPATPPAAGLALLRGMHAPDLRRLARGGGAPRWIEIAAARALSDGRTGGGRGDPGGSPSW